MVDFGTLMMMVVDFWGKNCLFCLHGMSFFWKKNFSFLEIFGDVMWSEHCLILKEKKKERRRKKRKKKEKKNFFVLMQKDILFIFTTTGFLVIFWINLLETK